MKDCPQCNGVGIEELTFKKCRKCSGEGVIKTAQQESAPIISTTPEINKKLKVSSIKMVQKIKTAAKDFFDDDEEDAHETVNIEGNIDEYYGDLPAKTEDENLYRKKLISGIISLLLSGNETKMSEVCSLIQEMTNDNNPPENKTKFIVNKCQSLPLEIVEKAYLILRN